MDDTLNFPNANSYWNVLKDLSNEAKLELIARLSNSLLHKEEVKTTSASDFYGVWKDSAIMIIWRRKSELLANSKMI